MLPETSFLKTPTLSQAVGIHVDRCTASSRSGGGQFMINTRNLTDVADNASHQAAVSMVESNPDHTRGLRRRNHDGAIRQGEMQGVIDVSSAASAYDDSDSEEDDDVEEDLGERWNCLAPLPLDGKIPDSDHKIDQELEAARGFRCGMIICPSLGETWGNLSLLRQLRVLHDSPLRKARSHEMDLAEARFKGAISRNAAARYSILRTYDTVVELLPPNMMDTSVVCTSLLERHNQHNASPLWDMPFSFRMSMILHVPELNMVIIGSMSGRVAVLRLTQPPKGCQPRRAFRVEWILPRASEENRRLRPYYSLLGIAVSPVPQTGARKLDLYDRNRPHVPPRRWRLLLNYMDHTILQYAIERVDPEKNDLALHPF